ncbi:MAG: hypothetical protein D3923_08465 [Candidatus Electrothrix sp. AR3]|nr:hypothetical protein [Candidatus Electrothrix sp. AR3]
MGYKIVVYNSAPEAGKNEPFHTKNRAFAVDNEDCNKELPKNNLMFDQAYFSNGMLLLAL